MAERGTERPQRQVRAPIRHPGDVPESRSTVGTYIAAVVAVLIVAAVVFVVLADNALRRGPEIPDILRATPPPVPALAPGADRAPIGITPEPVLIDLEVPAAPRERPPTPTAVPVLEPETPKYFIYTVESGDAIGAIASRFGFSFEEIASLNGIDEPYIIQVGERLLIPNR